MIDGLLSKYPLISDQVNKEQVGVILTELERVLKAEDDGAMHRMVHGGAMVEFGCYIGTTSLFVRRLLDARGDNREFHVYDSFEGLPPKVAQDDSPAGTQFQVGELSVSKKEFTREFQKAGLRPPVIHKAWFNDLTEADVPAAIALAFLDGDFYESIRDSLRLVLPKMTQGGTIIIDDYAREALPGVAIAVHEILPGTDVRIDHNLGIIHI
jgi:O-methyltransferase